MSTRSKSMGAGFAGSTANKVSVNGNSFGGSKKQGLAPKVGLSYWSSREVLIRANGQNATRDQVFCINQLGGIGAGNSMFRTAGSYARKDGIVKNSPACRPLNML